MSTAERRIPLGAALKIAEGLLEIFAPACHRIEIAGSARRKRSTVGDLEFVCIPKAGEPLAPQGTLFQDPDAARSNLLWEAIEAHSDGHNRLRPIKPGTTTIETDLLWPTKRAMGSRLFKLCLPRRGDIKVELWMGTPETWGCLLAIRTGSALFSKALVQRWTKVSGGGHVTNLRMWGDAAFKGATQMPFKSPEEADVFRLCRISWLEPKDRIDGSSLRPIS